MLKLGIEELENHAEEENHEEENHEDHKRKKRSTDGEEDDHDEHEHEHKVHSRLLLFPFCFKSRMAEKADTFSLPQGSFLSQPPSLY